MTAPVAELPAGVWACRHCGSPVVIRPIRDGRRWPFDREMLPADQVPEDLRYVPVPGGHVVVMVPAADMAPRRLDGVRWFAQRHTCAAWLRWYRDKQAAEQARGDDEAGSIAGALALVFGLDLEDGGR